MTLRLNEQELLALDRVREPRENRTDAIRRLIRDGSQTAAMDDVAARLREIAAQAAPPVDPADIAAVVVSAIRDPAAVRDLARAVASEIAGPTDAPGPRPSDPPAGRREPAAGSASRQSSIFDVPSDADAE